VPHNLDPVDHQEGSEVWVANGGGDALGSMSASKPDLVILDVMSKSILDGLRTVAEIRADSDLRMTPGLMVSSITGSELRISALLGTSLASA
jgi:DNA-binding response OmpR family regulator